MHVLYILLIRIYYLSLLADLWDLKSFGWQSFLRAKSKRTPAYAFREVP
jgi:hypothetical protein